MNTIVVKTSSAMNGQSNNNQSSYLKKEPKKEAPAKKTEAGTKKKSPEKNMSEIDEHILKRFDIKKRLGKGAYGIVWKAIDKKTKETVAVKKIFDAFRNQTDAQRTFREITFLQSFRNHPNIVKLHSIHKATSNRDIYLSFEYMETDLHNVIKRGNILRDVHKRYIMWQLLRATKYIHSGNVIHRDLKPSNVLIDSSCRVKIADFGLARSVSGIYSSGDGSEPCLTDYVATRWYRAPEILIASKSYTKGIDMWSLGCILGEMLIGKPLFPGTSTVNQVERIMMALPKPTFEDMASICGGYGSSLIRECVRCGETSLGVILSNAPRDATDLVRSLLVFNPSNRLSAERALEHDYVARFHREHEEPVLGSDVTLTLRDDKQVSVDDYRNQLYGLMSRSGHATVQSGRPRTQASNGKLTATPSRSNRSTEELRTAQSRSRSSAKAATADQRHRKSQNKPTNTISECKISCDKRGEETSAVRRRISQSNERICDINNRRVEHWTNEQKLATDHVRMYEQKLNSKADEMQNRLNDSLNRKVELWNANSFGDYFQPVTRHAPTEHHSVGRRHKVVHAKRNVTSFMIGDADCDALNKNHGVITASALLNLRSSIR